MKLKDEIACVFGLAALMIILMFLLINFNSCFILFEPRLWIRIPEIIICIFGIWRLSKLLYGKKKNIEDDFYIPKKEKEFVRLCRLEHEAKELKNKLKSEGKITS